MKVSGLVEECQPDSDKTLKAGVLSECLRICCEGMVRNWEYLAFILKIKIKAHNQNLSYCLRPVTQGLYGTIPAYFSIRRLECCDGC